VFDGLACLKDSLPTLTSKAIDKATDTVVDKPSDQAPASLPASKPLVDPTPTPTVAASTVVPEPDPEPEPEPVQTTPAVRSDDGPFIPSVDRVGQSAPFASWRQEPSLSPNKGPELAPGAASARSSRRDLEPTFESKFEPALEPKSGSGRPADSTSVSREPSLGALLDNDGQQWGVGSQSDPSVKIIGESRLRGDDPSAAGRAIPEFLEDEEEETTASRIHWVLGSLLLALVLMMQSLVVFRHDIVAAVPSLRPLLVTLCAPLSCEVNYVRQVERIFIVGSALQQDPNANVGANQRAYDLRLTLQNRGAYPQPWPALMLTLTDASGTPVIRRALMPSQFLSADLLDGPFQAGEEVGLDIALRVDGLSISGFELERFFP